MGMKDYKGLLLLLFRTLSHGGGVYGDEGLQEIVVVIIQDTFAWAGWPPVLICTDMYFLY
jgi:hypothetical protein